MQQGTYIAPGRQDAKQSPSCPPESIRPGRLGSFVSASKSFRVWTVALLHERLSQNQESEAFPTIPKISVHQLFMPRALRDRRWD